MNSIKDLIVYQVEVVEWSGDCYTDKTYFYKKDAAKRIKRLELRRDEYFSHAYINEIKITGIKSREKDIEEFFGIK